MAKLSKSEVKAAISKILARKEARPPIQPRRLPRRNFGKRLASLFAEAGIDVSKLEKIVSGGARRVRPTSEETRAVLRKAELSA